MDTPTLLPSLSLVTLIAVFVILVGMFLYFLRSRRNRQAAAKAHGLDGNG